MKTLQTFWHWVENEEPPASGTANVRDKTCTEVEIEAAGMAMDAVKARAGFRGWNQETFYEYLEPVRDLSLAICAALEAMHEAVPAAEPEERPKPMLVVGESQWHAPPTALRDVVGLMAEQNRILNEMFRADAAHIFESFKIEPIEMQLCPPCAELGSHACTTLDELCAECQKACGVVPKTYAELMKRDLPGDWILCPPDTGIGARMRHPEKNLMGTVRSVGCDHRTNTWTARVEWD